MKRFLLLLSTIFLLSGLYAQNNVGIGTQTPHASAALDVSSTTRGLLAPRMTTIERNAIASPAKGLLVYDTDLNSLYHYNGSSWANLAGGGGGFSLPFTASENLNSNVLQITNSGPGISIAGFTTHEFGRAVAGFANSAFGYGIYGYTNHTDAIAVYGDAGNGTAVKGYSVGGLGIDARSTNQSAIKASILLGANANPTIVATHAGAAAAVDGTSQTGYGLRGATSTASSTGAAVYGVNNGTQGNGMLGIANFASGIGIQGSSTTGIGVFGYSNSNRGVSGGTISGTALYGNSTTGYGLEVAGKVKISGGNTNPSNGAVLTSVDASGNAVWQIPSAQTKLAFRMQGTSTFETNGTSNNEFSHATYKKVEFQSENYDIGNGAQPTGSASSTSVTSTYVIQKGGVYHFDAGATFEFNLLFNYSRFRIRLMLNRGGAISSLGEVAYNAGAQTDGTPNLSIDRLLVSGDRVWIEANQSNTSLTSSSLYAENHRNYFNGHLVFEY